MKKVPRNEDLLPDQYEQFEEKSYWDKFFKERGNLAFEWYGSYRDLRPLVVQTAVEKEELLVIGCGNSDFSTELYQSGFHHVVNIDFSETVIDEMKAKTLSKCPKMQWLVMDVMDMKIKDNTYDVVLDKGTLDAIFSTAESEPQADRMLSEIDRVLDAEKGRYLVVTLGQDFIMKKLLETFGLGDGAGWTFDLHMLEQADPNEPSAFLTLVGIARRSSSSSLPEEEEGTSSTRSSIRIHFDGSAKRLIKPLCFKNGVDDHAEIMSLVSMTQERYQTKHELRHIVPGRFKGEINIWSKHDDHDDDNEEEEGEERLAAGPRYTLSIVDLVPPVLQPLPSAILLIPQGREHDFLFSTPDGLRMVGESSEYRRLICVRMNRGHKFIGKDEVQSELAPIVQDFLPMDQDPDSQVPILAVADGIGSRQIVSSGELPECGKYYVEEDEDEKDGGKGAVLRRLVFGRNQHVIQSEVRLVPPKKASSGGGGGGPRKKKGGKGGSKKSKAVLANGDANGEENEEENSLVMDWRYMSFDYHRAILAGLIGLLFPQLRDAKKTSNSLRCLVIGLGGGGLPLFLHRFIPCLEIEVVELEAGLAEVAKQWFGFQEDGQSLRIQVGDGIKRVQEAEQGSLDVIVVDVDNKDASLGISCPGPDFVTPAFLEECRSALTPDGILIMNVAARSTKLLTGALDALQSVFTASIKGELYEVQPTEADVNRVIFALKSPRSAPAIKTSLGITTERWLEDVKPSGTKDIDPLELAEMCDRIKKRTS